MLTVLCLCVLWLFDGGWKGTWERGERKGKEGERGGKGRKGGRGEGGMGMHKYRRRSFLVAFFSFSCLFLGRLLDFEKIIFFRLPFFLNL